MAGILAVFGAGRGLFHCRPRYPQPGTGDACGRRRNI